MSIAGFTTQEKIVHDILFYNYQEYRNQVNSDFDIYTLQNKTPYDLQPRTHLNQIFVDVENISVNILENGFQPILFSNLTNSFNIFLSDCKKTDYKLSFVVYYNKIYTLNPTIRAPGNSFLLI